MCLRRRLSRALSIPLVLGASVTGLLVLQAPVARASDDGAWSVPAPPAARRWHSAALDATNHRLVVFGGETARADLWTLSLDGAGVWSTLTAAGTVPSGRAKQVTVLDRTRNRMLVLGGYSTYQTFCDVWALNFAGGMSWTPIAATGSSSCQSQFSTAVYDALNRRVVVFGGSILGNPTSEFWTLDITGTQGTQGLWGSFGVLPGAPSPREGACSIYDPLRQRMIVLGGGETGNQIGNVFALSLGASPAWSALSPTGTKPPVRRFATAVHDPIGDRLLIFGGLSSSGLLLDDVWSLNLSGAPVWTPITIVGPAPSARYAHVAVFDSAANAMVIHGGQQYGPQSDEAWKLTLSGTPAWTRVGDPGAHPGALAGAAVLPDPAHDRLVVFGGGSSNTGSPAEYSDLWTQPLAGGSWAREVQTSGPSPRTSAAVILDPLRDELVVFGGAGTFGLQDDLWIQSRGSGSWDRVFRSGIWPVRRWGTSTIHDPLRDRVLMFGGVDSLGVGNQLWQFSLSSRTWTQLSPAWSPSPRYLAAAAYDPIGDRMLIFGGRSPSPNVSFNELWELPLSGPLAWSQVGSWTTPPSVRYGAAMTYDTVRNRILLQGGANTTMQQGTIALGDLWEFTWGATPRWTQLHPAGVSPGPVQQGAAVFDPSRDLFCSSRENGMVRVAFPAPTAVGEGGPGSPAGSRALPNPARAGVRIEFGLAKVGGYRVTVLDVGGRVLRVSTGNVASAGNVTVNWDGRTPSGERAAPGLYFYEVTAPDTRLRGRLVLLGP